MKKRFVGFRFRAECSCRRAAALALATAAFAGTASAADVVWSGGAGPSADGIHYWTNTANWAEGRLPGQGDTVVFRHDGAVCIEAKACTGYSYRFDGFKFESGATTIAEGTYFYFNDKQESDIYVAEGATACFSNYFSTVAGSSVVFRKTGKGDLSVRNIGVESGRKFAAVDVMEGSLSGVPMTRSRSFSAVKFIVRDGAELVLPQSDWITPAVTGTRPDIMIEKGGVLRVAGYNRISGLTGAGTVCKYDETVDTECLVLYPTNPACVFTGEIKTAFQVETAAPACEPFIVCATGTLAGCSTVKGSRYLSFAPGVGGPFRIGNKSYVPDAGWPLCLEDTEGNPVTVHAPLSEKTAQAAFETSGSGNFYSVNAHPVFTGGGMKHTGFLGNIMNSTTVKLGDGTAANDFDFSSLTGLDLDAGNLEIKNVSPLDFAGLLKGKVRVKVYTPSVFRNVAFTGEGGITAYKDIQINGGSCFGAFTPILFSATGLNFTLNGGVIGDSHTVERDNWSASRSVLPVPEGIVFAGDYSFGCSVDVKGGEIYLAEYDDKGVGRMTVHSGGRVVFACDQTCPNSATAENPAEFGFDGGELSVSFRSHRNAGGKRIAVLVPFPDNALYNVTVGAKGGRFTQSCLNCSYYDRVVHFKRPVATASGVEKDGGFAQYGYAPVMYYYAHTFNGPFKVYGGIAQIAETADLAPGPFFGGGDLELFNGGVDLLDRSATAESPLRLATAEGASLVYSGGSLVRLRNAKTASVQNVEIGAVERGDGGVLFLWDADKCVGDEGASSLRTASGMATHPVNGRVLQPVIALASRRSRWLTYDEEKGFVPLADSAFVTTAADSTKDSILYLGTSKLAASCVADGLRLETWNVLTLDSGVTLTLGDGTNPAILDLNSGTVNGSGSIAFGTSEAVIPLSTAGSVLSAKISSAAGVTIAGFPGSHFVKNDQCRLRFGGANTYGGETKIGAAQVFAENVKCFSSGKVNVLGGEMNGAQVAFNVKDGVWNNDFSVSGWGLRDSVWNDEMFTGAFSFRVDGTVAGDVDIVGSARFCAAQDVTGVVSGTVSGGRLEVADSPGVIRLAGSNTYTGGTEILLGTLEIAEGDGVGTGAVTLDGGVLRFVNDMPVTFTNEVIGVGTVEFAGTAPVTVTSPSFAALPFGKFAAGTVLHVSDPESNVYVPSVDGTLDLGGAAITVAGLAGSGRVADGTLTVTGVINPGGAGVTGSLTFADGVLVPDGAVYVCDIAADGSADRISFEGGFDLSALSFRTVGEQPSGIVRADVVTSAGTLSGAFSGVEQGVRRASVRYLSDRTVLCVGSALRIIVR